MHVLFYFITSSSNIRGVYNAFLNVTAQCKSYLAIGVVKLLKYYVKGMK